MIIKRLPITNPSWCCPHCETPKALLVTITERQEPLGDKHNEDRVYKQTVRCSYCHTVNLDIYSLKKVRDDNLLIDALCHMKEMRQNNKPKDKHK